MSLLEILSLSFSAAFAFLYALGALWLYARDVNEAIGVESNRGTILLTDEEMQRQQLQRLLEQNSSRKSLTPRAVQKTYRVNHPDRLNSFMPPQHEDGYFS
jgi:prophage antirepressor-like protein